VTGGVAGNGIRHTEHHRAGWIDDRIAGTEVPIVPLAAKWHGIILPRTLDGALHPHHTACGSISFQRRDGCGVRSDEISQERVIPVANDHAIIAEVNRRQVRGRKLGVSVPVSSDGVLKNGKAPWIVRLE
jgi:hypothetical protein